MKDPYRMMELYLVLFCLIAALSATAVLIIMVFRNG